MIFVFNIIFNQKRENTCFFCVCVFFVFHCAVTFVLYFVLFCSLKDNEFGQMGARLKEMFEEEFQKIFNIQ